MSPHSRMSDKDREAFEKFQERLRNLRKILEETPLGIFMAAELGAIYRIQGLSQYGPTTEDLEMIESRLAQKSELE